MVERSDIARDIAAVLNRYSAENVSGTPDYILAEVALDAIKSFNERVWQRAEWRGESVHFEASPFTEAAAAPAVEAPKEKTRLDEFLEQVSQEQATILEDYARHWDLHPEFREQFGENFQFYIYDRAMDTDLAPTQDELDVKFTVSLKVRRPTLKEQEDDRLRKAAEERADRQIAEGIARRKAEQDERDLAELREKLRGSSDRVSVGFYSVDDVVKAAAELQRMLDEHGYFTKSDFYTLGMYTITREWNFVGWDSLHDIQLYDRGGEGNRHVISLPAPKDLRPLVLEKARKKKQNEPMNDIAFLTEAARLEHEEEVDSENSAGGDSENETEPQKRARRIAEAEEERSEREARVFNLKDKGLSNRAIANALSIAESTVRYILDNEGRKQKIREEQDDNPTT